MQFPCPACQLALELTPQMAGQQMACPRCGAVFTAAGLQPHALPLGQAPPPPFSPLPQLPFESDAGSNLPRSNMRATRERPATLLDLFDLTFQRYVTPLIVKITWVLALVLAAVWLAMIVFGLFASALPESNREREQLRPSRQIEFGVPSELMERTNDAAFGVVLRIALLITQVIAVVLFLLWVRVALESVIVIFNMASLLRSIDRKTKG